jgi:hypothetical protein
MAVIGIGVVAIVVAAGLAIGTADRQGRRGALHPVVEPPQAAAVLNAPSGSSAGPR